jgi:GMP synthase-like glutamine amidotransferase
MTSILIVGNKISEGPRIGARTLIIEKIFRSYPAQTTAIDYDDLQEIPEGIDAIVLAGSKMNLSEDPIKKRIAHITGLIRDTDLPVLGICFGFHLVMHSYGCTVKRNEASGENEEPNGKIIQLEIADDLGIVKKGIYPVNVAHRDYVDPADPALKEFRVHAISWDGDLRYLQYASHMEKQVHAFQFHPECYDGAPRNAKETGIEFLHGFLYDTLHE